MEASGLLGFSQGFGGGEDMSWVGYAKVTDTGHMEKGNHESNDIIVMMRQNGIPKSDQWVFLFKCCCHRLNLAFP
jgi:hypothetical protein